MMNSIFNWFEKIKKSNDPEKINDFLIEISKHPRLEYLSLIDYFIGYLAPKIHEQIKINLIYNLGELGKLERIDIKFIDYLMNEYYNSDRWIRNEIIIAFDKISMSIHLSEQVIGLIAKALNEDYEPIKTNSLKVLLHVENIPKFALKNVIQVLNTSTSEIEELSTIILQKAIRNENNLFDLLKFSETYKNLNKRAIRSLLLINLNSIASLESFRELVSKSNWEGEFKEKFLSEIGNYENLMLKKSLI
ncbi:MAG: hypothetical protein ACFFDO_02950 [Candidatus Thorarchaeota archaeon]